jgi:peptidoglycan/LPS O-acetylase OafA/YrhL
MPDSVDGLRMNGTQAAMPDRNLSVDFYRVSAIGLVVVGHWLVASATYRDGEFGMQNVLVEMPWTQWLTLAFQVIPAFFLMAGYASAVSWTRRRETGAEPAQSWLRYRLARTLGPTGAYMAIVLAVVLVLLLVGVDSSKLDLAAGRSPTTCGSWSLSCCWSWRRRWRWPQIGGGGLPCPPPW